MTVQLVALGVAATDPPGLARFWAGVLDGEATEDPAGGVTLRPGEDIGFQLRFVPTQEPKSVPNQMHLDLTSTSLEHQQQTVTRSLGLGARHIDVGQRPDEGHVVLADPEGNEFCVIGPGNSFLADCGFVGAVACDGSQEVGYFWSAALDWPLVWDQDLETAIRSPHGGPKITWGGESPLPGGGTHRLHLDLAPPPDADHRAEVDRLVSLGATRLDSGQGDVGWVVLADPDGHRFRVRTPS